MRSLLVTNDFPPKVGGIQSYLWELWRRLPPEETTVLTASQPGDRSFDAAQAFRIERTPQRVLLPTPRLRNRIDRLAADVDAALVVLDPALPLGLLGPRLERPYALVVHGAEVTVPARLPVAARALANVLDRATAVVAAGRYPAAECTRVARGPLAVVVVPPGVDSRRFRPLDHDARHAARRAFGLPTAGPLVVSVSRLVPRKGMDVLIDAAARLAPDFPGLTVAIAGAGRDRPRLERRAAAGAGSVRFLGRVADDRLPDLYGCADVFAMLCRTRWRGLEQEGFGIVFVEAAACGVAQIAGNSGGAADAVLDGETGLVVADPSHADDVTDALARLLGDPSLRDRMGAAARRRAAEELSYDVLAARLAEGLERLSRATFREK